MWALADWASPEGVGAVLGMRINELCGWWLQRHLLLLVLVQLSDTLGPSFISHLSDLN